MATQARASKTPRVVPTYDIHEFHSRQSRYAVLIPVIEEGDRLLKQLGRMEFLRGKGDILILLFEMNRNVLQPTGGIFNLYSQGRCTAQRLEIAVEGDLRGHGIPSRTSHGHGSYAEN